MSSRQQTDDSSFGLMSTPKREEKNDALTRRASHNRIEKRYRENLNDRFAALADAISSSKDALPPANNTKSRTKTSILSRAVDRIEELRVQNLSLKRIIERERIFNITEDPNVGGIRQKLTKGTCAR
ncbi:hypothetical protein BJX96DRAFT_161120 [Aspergillus floccosus]